ncbi:hypothetical protein HZA87_00270 [Candidatus Uhrbacteria bacterium]|nr:hypothetical protein [Candidatus Uhrbacteria bacterium]
MNRILLSVLAPLIALFGIKIPVWGVVAVEHHFNSYPVISQETADSMTELTAAYSEFDRACYCYKSGTGASLGGESCEGIANEASLDQAKSHRQIAATKLDPSLLTAIVLGVNYHTHATWTCSGSANDPKVNINPSFTATYDVPAEPTLGREYINSSI